MLNVFVHIQKKIMATNSQPLNHRKALMTNPRLEGGGNGVGGRVLDCL